MLQKRLMLSEITGVLVEERDAEGISKKFLRMWRIVKERSKAENKLLADMKEWLRFDLS